MFGVVLGLCGVLFGFRFVWVCWIVMDCGCVGGVELFIV